MHSTFRTLFFALRLITQLRLHPLGKLLHKRRSRCMRLDQSCRCHPLKLRLLGTLASMFRMLRSLL